ncbi:MAG: hypothetical protein PWP23_2650 [Candidatus Sumerlaeota bacterium]|nr:hypothetical protein [Candidatus Sumerlaeota bacterium]
MLSPVDTAPTGLISEPGTRRCDVDWLRSIALCLLILYHVGIAFQPWGGLLLFITNMPPLEEIWPAMSLVNVWRIPLLFVISGMGVFFATQRRGWLALLQDRAVRILVPLVFGSLTICPLYFWIGQKWFGFPPRYMPAMGHLWFLANIFAYVVILLPLFVFLRSARGLLVLEPVRRALARTWPLFLWGLPLVAEAWLVNPDAFVKYYDSLHGFLLGGICFLLGFLLVASGHSFWKAAEKLRWPALAAALGLYVVRLLAWKTGGPNAVLALESSFWMLALFGFGSLHLNRPSALLTYMSAAVYPVYIVHMPVQYAVSYFLMPVGIPAWVKLVLLSGSTLLGSFGVYEVLKRLKWLRPLFGMKLSPGGRNRPRGDAAPPPPVEDNSESSSGQGPAGPVQPLPLKENPS